MLVFTKGKKRKSASFYLTQVGVRAKLTFDGFLFWNLFLNKQLMGQIFPSFLWLDKRGYEAEAQLQWCLDT